MLRNVCCCAPCFSRGAICAASPAASHTASYVLSTAQRAAQATLQRKDCREQPKQLSARASKSRFSLVLCAVAVLTVPAAKELDHRPSLGSTKHTPVTQPSTSRIRRSATRPRPNFGRRSQFTIREHTSSKGIRNAFRRT